MRDIEAALFKVKAFNRSQPVLQLINQSNL